MILHKTTGTAANTAAAKPTSEPSAQKVQMPAQTVKPAASLHPAAAVAGNVSHITKADKFSASIISFFRFFSLPLKPELITSIRRQAFTQLPIVPQANTATARDITPALFQSLSLASAAAESKGVELVPKGLELFAEFIDPALKDEDSQQRHDSQGQQRRQQNNGKDETEPQKAADITAAGLKKMAIENAEKDPLLAILNRLPGKDRKRWMVFPFSFRKDGSDFNVSMRILLEPELLTNRSILMALDVQSKEQKQLFVMEAAGGKLNRLTAYTQDELSCGEQDLLARELSGILGILPEHIFIKTRTDIFPCESGCGNIFSPIDEEI
jgi:hypothetical protein